MPWSRLPVSDRIDRTICAPPGPAGGRLRAAPTRRGRGSSRSAGDSLPPGKRLCRGGASRLLNEIGLARAGVGVDIVAVERLPARPQRIAGAGPTGGLRSGRAKGWRRSRTRRGQISKRPRRISRAADPDAYAGEGEGARVQNQRSSRPGPGRASASPPWDPGASSRSCPHVVDDQARAAGGRQPGEVATGRAGTTRRNVRRGCDHDIVMIPPSRSDQRILGSPP